jgi:fumarate reductase flavoprotein subunit
MAEAKRQGAEDSCDVLVVGGGAAGLSAALTARQRGMRVILIEKEQALGGSTAISIGSFTAVGTRWQRAKGIVDSVDDFIDDMYQFPAVVRNKDNPELRALLAAEAGPALAWLDALGVPFVGPFPEPPHRLPRMHNVVPDSGMYIRVLGKECEKAGVRIRMGAALVALSSDASGRVAGATIRQDAREFEIEARRAVILASGDFSGNAEMRAKYLRPQAAPAIPANPNNMGDGQRIAAGIGAQLRSMQLTSGPKLRFVPGNSSAGLLASLPRWKWLMRTMAAIANRLPRGALRPFVKSLLVVHMQPSPKLFEAGTILVNLRGERFSDEQTPALDLAMQPEARGYLVFDQRIREQFQKQPNFVSTAPGVGYAFMNDYERARPDLFTRGADAASLAHLLGVDVAPIERALASTGGRLSPPYIAMGPVVSTVTTTEGGLVVDRSCAVLDNDAATIGGLYAAGSVAQSGMTLFGHGLHIGWAVVSGRIAGRSASAEVPLTTLPESTLAAIASGR